MTIASIDIGSNTVLLLIVQFDPHTGSIFTVTNRYMTPRLSEGLHIGEKLKQSKIDSLFEILSDYKRISSENKCANVLIRATNAFRIASNAAEIINLISNKYSPDVKILSGDEEARLTFLGTAFPLSANKYKTVIDIGGGSTELIYGNATEIFYKKSFDIGVVSLTEKFYSKLPATKESLKNATEYIDNIFIELSDLIPPGIETIAVAGTPTTLSCMQQGMKIYRDELVDNSTISTVSVMSIINQLANMKKEEVAIKFGEVVNGREDLLLAGSQILHTIMEILRLENIIVSSKGLRYGTIINYLIENQLIKMDK